MDMVCKDTDHGLRKQTMGYFLFTASKGIVP